jgi:rhodanese-related sulfurtransferase
MMTAPPDVHLDEAIRLLNEADAVLLDVREDDEWAAGHAPGAVHMRLGDLDPSGLAAAKPVVAVCRSGNRSRTAAIKLAGAGITVYNLAGGMKAWHCSGRPVVRDDGAIGTAI